ncbi:MAG: methylenetetrahydrofolate reductase [Microbacteriaceae bacterium]
MSFATPVSFELFPPRTDAAALALGRTIDKLAEIDPAFFSVTFGAGGSTRDRSLTVLSYILEHTTIDAMAHLTCVGSSHEQANQLVRQFLDAGVTSFLALRGDPPAEGEHGLGDLGSAAELVQLILRVQEEREPFAQVPVVGQVGASSIRGRNKPVRVAVAAFPAGHPRDGKPQQDLDALLAKQVAGATLAITQLFWQADDYLDYVEWARAFGVTIDILPGIMPVTNPARLQRLEELTGVPVPQNFAQALRDANTPEQAASVGTAHAAALAEQVLRGGAPGLHLYTFNQHEAVLETLHQLRLRQQ